MIARLRLKAKMCREHAMTFTDGDRMLLMLKVADTYDAIADAWEKMK